ncbi:DoxX family protein [Fulvimonas yonginensis]|uniref:DoxX family protein n=1 Tax=Fulvimonas yonginensis TaxID=1495200 RepID=A0ABU8JBT6_9GAMM
MRYTLFDKVVNELLLVARVLLVLLFVLFGWSKLTDFPGTVGYMAAEGLPLPTLAAAVVILMEFFVGLAIVLGFWTRPLALLLALYTLGTALIGHHFWTMAGGERMANMTNFYKNVSIIGGLLLLCVTGPGRYSLDRR